MTTAVSVVEPPSVVGSPPPPVPGMLASGSASPPVPPVDGAPAVPPELLASGPAVAPPLPPVDGAEDPAEPPAPDFPPDPTLPPVSSDGSGSRPGVFPDAQPTSRPKTVIPKT